MISKDLDRIIEMNFKAASAPVTEAFMKMDDEDSVSRAKDTVARYLPAYEVIIEEENNVAASRDPLSIWFYPMSADNACLRANANPSIGFEEQSSQDVLMADPRYVSLHGKDLLQAQIFTSTEATDIGNIAFLVNHIRRIRDDLRKSGYDSFFEANDLGNLDIYVMLPNDRQAVEKFLDALTAIVRVPDFVDQGIMPLEAYGHLLSQHYTNIRPMEGGFSRHTFLADFAGGQRVIKIDREDVTDPEHPNAERMRQRGYTTLNELNIAMRIVNPEKHHLTRLVDYIVMEDFGYEGIITIEDHFDAPNLAALDKSVFEDIGALDQFASQLIGAVRFMNESLGIYHRDLKPENILVNAEGYKRGNTVDIRVTDFALAAEVESTIPKDHPSIGGHWIVDPMIFSCFNGGIEAAYDQRSELYAIGVNLYYAITGKYIFEFNPDKKTGIVVATGESVLNADGTIDRQKYGKAIADAIVPVARNDEVMIGDYAVLLNRLLSLDSNYSVSELKKDHELYLERHQRLLSQRK